MRIAILLVSLPLMAAATEPTPPFIFNQPTRIEDAAYRERWPALAPCLEQLGAPRERCLDALGERDDSRAGVLNLRAQQLRLQGQLEAAEDAIEAAVAREPEQHLHHFQQAMIAFATLQAARTPLDQWRAASAVEDAYRKAFSLQSAGRYYRYYLAYALLQKPAFVGGDKQQALKLADDGVALGDPAFLVVRADVHRVLEQPEAALADYDAAQAANVYKRSSFAEAVRLALVRDDTARAERYLAFIDQAQPDWPGRWLLRADYLLANNDADGARRCLQQGQQRHPDDKALRARLAELTEGAAP
jgi:hypothetical protein